MKATIFVSYSHVNFDRDKLNYLLDLIKKKAKSRVNILIDIKDSRLGGSLAEFMSLLDEYEVDAVLMALTPSYKNKILNNEGSVPREFSSILARYHADRDRVRESKQPLELYEELRMFGLLPVIISGNRDNAVPVQISELRHSDIASVITYKDNDDKVSIPSLAHKQEIDKLADGIFAELKNIAKNKAGEYRERRNDIRTMLFSNTKAGTSELLESEVFVRTITYQRVLNQEAYFIVGRKGSGKSTLTRQLELINKRRYLRAIHIDLSRISIEFIYALYTNDKFTSDSGIIHSYRSQYLEYCWECAIVMCFIWGNRKDAAYGSWLQSKFEADVLEFDEQDFIKTALTYAIEKYAEFQDEVIRSSRNTLSSIPARVSRKQFLNYVFGETLVKNATSLCASVLRSTLVTLDGIDSASADYRLEFLHSVRTSSADSLRRARAETDLIKTLMRLISGVKASPKEFPFLSACDFCVTIPLDLFQEIREFHERDSYRWLSSCRTLDWTGPELAVMIRKRIEVLVGRRIDKDKFYLPEQRLAEALEDFYPDLPKEISIEVAGKTFTYPLFLYVLRHSFWRPREIIFHFVGLISSFEYFSHTAPINARDLEAIVHDQARALISTEFIDEFKATIINIEEIVSEFRLGPQFIPWKLFLDKLSRINFAFYASVEDPSTYLPSDKARLLYEIGFIGVRLTDEQMKNLSRPKDTYSFSEGVQIFDTLLKGVMYSDNYAVIHPAFIEYLSLDVKSNHDIVMDLSWEYLMHSERRRNATEQW
ncbi:MAG: hypothetical protein ABSC62_14625 [Terracidiphilus sp.]